MSYFGGGHRDLVFQQIVDAHQHACVAAFRLQPGAIFVEHREQPVRGLGRAIGNFGNTTQEKDRPRFPVALRSYFLQQIVVRLAVRLKIKTQIEQWFVENFFWRQNERYQQPSDAPIAIGERDPLLIFNFGDIIKG